ncbi:hypothetical protein VOI54_17845, partial [Tamlana sp. 2201CG12-4]|uniref:hypothetical protein n=1 Tax=Tamlana sp. 2201CG12-4 TaxID=3112582 RepID=UPI002DB99EA5
MKTIITKIGAIFILSCIFLSFKNSDSDVENYFTTFKVGNTTSKSSDSDVEDYFTTFKVGNTTELLQAAAVVQPGDVIELEDGIYNNFLLELK